MQLMPSTARSMARRAGVSLRADKGPEHERIVDPELNLTLAQEYISLLLKDDNIKGNLLLLACAYNSGPGPIQRWKSQPEFRNDPLLFLESIPSRQSRVFTQHVLTNYWVYRQRLGQPMPDLDALAAGQWPTYTALDSSTSKGGRHASTR
jgi:soluble lytic murein transglycosylase-like protein